MRLLQLFAVMLMVSVSLAMRATFVCAMGNRGVRSRSLSVPQVAVVCFLQGEVISGFNKICYYDCLDSQAAITIASVQLCPLNIQR
jgi:hypothetical protein